MSDSELMFRPVNELAAMVESGELSASELVDVSLSRIDELNPTYNAFIEVFDGRARADAAKIKSGDDRPLAGVPVAIKNNTPVEGGRLTFASAAIGDFRADADAFLVRRLRDAGAIVVGSTNLPEFGIQPTTEPRDTGATRNPWDVNRTPGGSSGGSAAAVAAGMVPLAHANDGGGSTRIPAACCGLVGLKPQRGRISAGPAVGGSFLGIDGVLTRTTAETALALDVLAGYEPGDAFWPAPPIGPFSELAGDAPKGLKIAMTVSPPLVGAPVDAASIDAVQRAAELLRELGHEVVEADPPWSVPGMLELFSALFCPMISTQIAFAQMIAGRELTEGDIEPLSWEIWQQSQQISAVIGFGAEIQIQALARSVVAWSQSYDAILCPALAEPPVTLGTIDSCSERPMEAFARGGQFTPFTAIANVTGSPAISLPLFQNEELNLPLAVQLIGRPEGEAQLLALSAQLENALPWAGRRAPLTAS